MSNVPYGKFHGDKSATYVATPQIAEIVNLAVRLGRPLLVEGESGCGKTRLASAIAEEFGVAAGDFVSATIKSTSQAKDLLYRFDALRRLQDAQDPKNSEARFVHPYIELEPLGHAIWNGRPCVVLIDEIDKADIDFPNDLLDVFDNFHFDIEDLPRKEDQLLFDAKGFRRRVQARPGGVRPLVIITSNREKQLPEPFLRRCMYLQLDFPEDAVILRSIVKCNLGTTPNEIGDDLISAAVKRFLEVRSRSRERHLQKLPATTELLDWVVALQWRGGDAASVRDKELDATDEAVLFKIRQDIERFRTQADG